MGSLAPADASMGGRRGVPPIPPTHRRGSGRPINHINPLLHTYATGTMFPGATGALSKQAMIGRRAYDDRGHDHPRRHR